ncbi:unnamed protein product [Urochloa humidicola]
MMRCPIDEDPYVFFNRIKGAPEYHPDHVQVGVPRSDAIRADERALEIYALLAVQMDASVQLPTEVVRREAIRQLEVPVHELGVSLLASYKFLLKFDGRDQRNAAWRKRILHVGHYNLSLLPWSRRVDGELSKFLFRARLCIEGVSGHARQPEVVASLFKSPVFIEEFNCQLEKPEEESCVRLWAWTSDPDGFAKTGTLQIAEPATLPEEGYVEMLEELGMPMLTRRRGPTGVMDYEVIIHVDRLFDYSDPPNYSSCKSVDSIQSGIPAGDDEESWPPYHNFVWHLGVPDVGVQRRRVPVQERLGRPVRQQLPPRDGGAGGLGLC